MPRFSDDDYVDHCVVEAIRLRVEGERTQAAQEDQGAKNRGSHRALRERMRTGQVA